MLVFEGRSLPRKSERKKRKVCKDLGEKVREGRRESERVGEGRGEACWSCPAGRRCTPWARLGTGARSPCTARRPPGTSSPRTSPPSVAPPRSTTLPRLPEEKTATSRNARSSCGGKATTSLERGSFRILVRTCSTREGVCE